MQKLIYTGKVDKKDGLLRIANLRLMKLEVKEHLKGHPVFVTIEKQPDKLTQKRVAFWLGYVVPTVQSGLRSVGHIMTPEQTNRYLCDLFLGAGQVIGETDCNLPLDFKDLITNVTIWAAENLGVVLGDMDKR